MALRQALATIGKGHKRKTPSILLELLHSLILLRFLVSLFVASQPAAVLSCAKVFSIHQATWMIVVRKIETCAF